MLALILVVRHFQKGHSAALPPVEAPENAELSPSPQLPVPEEWLSESGSPPTYAEAIRHAKDTPQDQVREWMEDLTNKGPTREDRTAAHLWLAKELLANAVTTPTPPKHT